MVTFEQLRKIARENVTDLMVMELLKEFPHLNPDRANHVCCYIARMIGLANQYVYNHEEWNYIGEVGNETIIVHPDHGIKFGDINKIIFDEENQDEVEEDLCQCDDCVRARRSLEARTRQQEAANNSQISSAPQVSGVMIDAPSETVEPPVVEPTSVFDTQPPAVQTHGTYSIGDSTLRWWNAQEMSREIEIMNQNFSNYYNIRNLDT